MISTARCWEPRSHGMAMAIVLLLMTSLWGSDARATTDGGLMPRLLAFAGPNERWAIVALESVQEPCGFGPCTVVALDLEAASYRERWPLSPPRGEGEIEEAELVDAFLESLPDDADELAPLRRLSPTDGEPHDAEGEQITFESATLALEERRRVPSMRPYAVGSQQDCGMWTGGDPCSSCSNKPIELNGAPLEAWACEETPGTFARSGAPCDCHAEGRVVALAGEGFVAREVLVAPYQLGQNVMNGPGIEPDTEVVLRAGQARLHRNASDVPLVLAGAVHAPMANGTWFPLIAYRPAKSAAVEPAEPPTPMTPGAGAGVRVDVAPAPKTGGCAGCAVVPGPRDRPWAWPFGVLLALVTFLWRRR